MPLEAVIDPAVYIDPGSVAVVFKMKNFMIDETVSVTVAWEAIQKLGGSPSPIEVFKAHRAELERIASNKFDHQGGGTEVTVREEDLN